MKDPETAEKSETKLEGIFGNKEIKLETLAVPGNNKLLINIHGSYGSISGNNDKYRKLANSLQTIEASNVTLYESSRKDIDVIERSEDEFTTKKRRFEGKTFKEELEDLRKVIKHCLDNSQELFGISAEELEITLNGNSLGGILALVIAHEFPQIKNVSTVGTGLKLENTDEALLRTLPEPNELKDEMNKFKGKFLMQYGTKDDVFSDQSFTELYESIDTSKSLFKFEQVDHTFNHLDGKSSSRPYEQIFRNIEELLEGRLIGGSTHLTHEDDEQQQEDDHKKTLDGVSKEIKDLGLEDNFNSSNSEYDETATENY